LKRVCLFVNLFLFAFFYGQAQVRTDSIKLLMPLRDSTIRLLPLNIPANFYSANTGFFCKKELLLEKKTKIPFRFRLGTLEYCDRLEGKKGNSNSNL